MTGGSVIGGSNRFSSPSLTTLRARRLWGPSLVAISAATLIAPLVTKAPTAMVLIGVASLVLMMSVCAYPPLAAYLLLGLTPLMAGIDRGALIPVLRPSEAVDLLLGAGLIGALIIGTAVRPARSESAQRIGRSIVIMAVVSSVIPLLWMIARGVPITSDDILYAFVIWKLYGVYLLIRTSVRSEVDIRRCLWISMTSAAVVGVVAIFQVLGLFGVGHVLSTYYVNFGNAGASLVLSRGSSTLALPIAVADLMTFNLALAVALLVQGSRRRKLLFAFIVIFVAGVIAAGEISGVLGLALGALTTALILRRFAPLLVLSSVGVAAASVLRSVVQARLEGFSSSASGIPESWVGRLNNLRTYFWPQLSSHYNFILGLRPTARVVEPAQITGYVWIESGYTWLLWAGGIPFLLSFLYFTLGGIRTMAANVRERADAVGVAATAALVGLVVVGCLMMLDPHLTYRGSSDLLFGLLALGAWTAGSHSFGGDTKEPARSASGTTSASL